MDATEAKKLRLRFRSVAGTMCCVLLFSIAASFSFAASPGDANNDGKIDQADVTAVLNQILGIEPVSPGADCNLDGAVNIQDVICIINIINQPPPDLPNVAPPLDNTLPTTLGKATEFLYTGRDPIQTGVAPGTIDPQRVGVFRGKVLDGGGNPLAGVRITILSHPEYGHTLSRVNGMFDMAVNGGGLLTVNYQKVGYLTAQRQVNVPWQDYAWLPDVVMIPSDLQVTTIDLTSSVPMQVARGSVQSDNDGTRRATLLFPQGTGATMKLPNGDTQSLTTLNVRATEFTVGPNGPKAMPAILPPNSAYTYCVELGADEAVAAGANQVLFSQPLPFYVENFLNFPVGTNVPVGYYDREKGVWIPSDNGKVIKIVSITGGMANLDTDGDGTIDNALGLTNAERTQLASLYSAGTSLWRFPIQHLTFPWDSNWGMGCSAKTKCERPEEKSPKPEDSQQCSSTQGGSIVECQNQTLGESIGIVGTPFTLNYRSDRGPGHRISNQLKIPLSEAGVVDLSDVKYITLEILLAGRRFEYTFPPRYNQSMIFNWDGKDAYGRVMQGAQHVRGGVGYVYNMIYGTISRFGETSDMPITGNRARMEITFWQDWETTLGTLDARGQGLGGWSLNVHHAYDPVEKVLYLGDGSHYSNKLYGGINTVAGNGKEGLSGDNGPATEAELDYPYGVAVGSDGSFYIADSYNGLIRRVGPDGIITTVAGGGSGTYDDPGDGGPATEAWLSEPTGVALGRDGSLYIADFGLHRVRRVGLDGIITTVAGGWGNTELGDGGPATEALLLYPTGVAVGPDGSLYISQPEENRVRRVGTDGIITTVAGNGTYGYGGDGGLAVQAQLNYPSGVAVGPDGGIYIADNDNHRIRRVGPDGIITTVAGVDTWGYSGDGGPATQAELYYPWGVSFGRDGSLYIADAYNHVIRRLGPDGIITTVAGSADGCPLSTLPCGDGGPATQAQLAFPHGVAVGPDGSIYIADYENHRIRRVAPVMPGFAAGDFFIPSPDGSEVYHFSAQVRHLRTLDALTGVLRYQFTYDSEGRLTAVQDGDGNTTAIERDADGNATAIVGPYGQRTALSLNANGFLTSVTNPAGEAVQLGYTSDLLTTFTDPKGNIHHFTYDPLGHLIKDEDPAGGFKTLVRTGTVDNYSVTVTTALGRASTYEVEVLPTGEIHRVNTSPDGTKSELVIGTDGSQNTTYPDGTVVFLQQGPEPRWGMQAPIMANLAYKVPSGLTGTIIGGRTATLTDPTDLLSLKTLTDSITINGRTFTNAYDASTRTVTSTSAEGRKNTATLDTHGRVIEEQVTGLFPISYGYDSHGRLANVVQGTGIDARTLNLTYKASGYLDTVTDPLGRAMSFDYNTAGRPVTQTWPGGNVVGYAYDANSNLTAITPPGRPAHQFVYTSVDLISEYVPPDVGAGTTKTQYAYNADQQLTRVTRPDAQTTELGYTEGSCNCGRLSSLTFSRGMINYTYDPITATVRTIEAPGGLFLGAGYDGTLFVTETWSGSVVGSVSRPYDNSLRIWSRSVNGGNPINLQYDNDNFLIQAGDLILDRDAQTGLITGSTLGKVTTATTYSGFGEPETYGAAFDGAEILAVQYSRDKLGRVTQKTETIEGSTDTYNYAYDLGGRLVEVKKNGSIVSTYTYDSNGNRVSGPEGTATYSYDAQDRLTQSSVLSPPSSTIYAYTVNGELLTKEVGGQTTTYDYDELGNLTRVVLPNGRQIDYVIDGRSRRIGKKIKGALVQGVLYQDGLKPIVELDGTGAVVSRFVYTTRVNVPDYLIKGGTTYRIVTDQLGSPRMIIDVATGSVAQRMDYDEFGNVINDTNPGFQPFGFAGGLYDHDTQLVRFDARDYDTQAGRWTTKDPLLFQGGRANLYVYVGNNPVNKVDPRGLQETPQQEMERKLNELHERQAADETAHQEETLTKVNNLFSTLENGARAVGDFFFVTPGKYWWGKIKGAHDVCAPGNPRDGLKIIKFIPGQGPSAFTSKIGAGVGEYGADAEDAYFERTNRMTQEQ